VPRRPSKLSSPTSRLVRWWGGDAGAAEREVRAAYQWFAGRGEIEEAGVVASELAEILFDLGRLDEAEALADETARVTAHYDLEPQIGWRSVKGKVLTHRGALDAAEILARDALDLVSRTEFLTLRGRAWMDLAGILARSGRGAEANEAALEAHSAFELKRNRVELRKLKALGDRLGFLAG